MDYDVIISGGSFAGLAAAAQLRGKRVLLVEPNPIGKVQTSACGTLLDVLEVTGTMDSLLQIHNHFVFHAPQRSYEMSLPYDFCTFDYEIFCQRLLAQSEVEILRASVKGHQGHLVLTTRGDFEACALIDATGWRAALATNGQQRAQAYKGRASGSRRLCRCKGRACTSGINPNGCSRKVSPGYFPQVLLRAQASVATWVKRG